jgi:hypothetical protein
MSGKATVEFHVQLQISKSPQNHKDIVKVLNTSTIMSDTEKQNAYSMIHTT